MIAGRLFWLRMGFVADNNIKIASPRENNTKKDELGKENEGSERM